MKFTKRSGQKSESSGGNYLKLTDGLSVNGVMRGEIFEFYQIWPFGGERQVFDSPTPGAASRFKANIVIHENGKFISKIWEFGLPVYTQLGDINEVYPLDKTKIQITRRGAGKSTQYMILPLLNEQLSPKILAQIESVELHPLALNVRAPAPTEERYDELGF